MSRKGHHLGKHKIKEKIVPLGTTYGIFMLDATILDAYAVPKGTE